MLNRHNVDYVDIAPRGNETDKELEEATVRNANSTQLPLLTMQ